MGTYEPLDREWSDDVADAGLFGDILHFESQVTADDEIVNPPLMISFVKRAAQVFEAQYAHVHLLVEQDPNRRPRPERGYVGYRNEPGEYGLMVIEQRLRSSMLELWWGTVLGPEYVSLIGAEVIERAPAYLVERLGQDGTGSNSPRILATTWWSTNISKRSDIGSKLIWGRISSGYPNALSTRHPRSVESGKHRCGLALATALLQGSVALLGPIRLVVEPGGTFPSGRYCSTRMEHAGPGASASRPSPVSSSQPSTSASATYAESYEVTLARSSHARRIKGRVG
jgi:hypothetical protein